MPTRATRKGCGGRILINRPCRPNRRSRLFNRKKLTQIIIRTCEEWGTYDVQAAIEDALRQGCDKEEREKKREREAENIRELKAELDLAWAKLAALLAALALLECLSDDDREKIKEVEADVEDAIGPIRNGTVFVEGGGYGGGRPAEAGELRPEGLTALMVEMCETSGADAVRDAVLDAMAECNATAYPEMCSALRSAKAGIIEMIDNVKPLLRFADRTLMMLANLGVISSEEWSRALLEVHLVASGGWETRFDQIALELGCRDMPAGEPFTTGGTF